jgi:UDP-glucuronate 4-epimerase
VDNDEDSRGSYERLVLKYLVTGACGFIASKVVELLLSEGHSVVGIDNVNDAYDTRLKEWRLKRIIDKPRFQFHKLDICDRAGVHSVLSSLGGLDGLINLAARAGVRQSVENPWAYLETNSTGTLNLLEECRNRGVRKFVQASTSSLYGLENPVPYSEEMSTSRPLSPYAASKKAAESLCYSYHYLYGLDVMVLRYFTVYGPAGRPDMSLFRFVQWISEDKPVIVFGDGSQSRDFTYVDDIARGTVAALQPAGYSTINLGCDHPVMLMDTIHLVERLVGKTAQIEFKNAHPADVPATWANITRARNELNWKPEISLDEGVARLVDWYQENRAWAREIHTV